MSKLRYVFVLIFAMYINFTWSQFIENNGQWIDHKEQLGEDIDFKLEMAGVNVYFRPEGIVYHFHHKEDKDFMSYTAEEKEKYVRGDLAEIGYKVYFFRLDFDLIGANKSAPKLKIDEQKDVRNYYFGHCPNGIINVKSYKTIVYENIYPNIDLKYLLDDGKLKYEFILHPGANPSDIRFTYTGAESLRISEGKLMIRTAYNSLSEDVPFSYYANSGKEIKSSFVVDENNIVSFNINAKSISEDIVIDPAISWATYYNPDLSSGFHANSVYDSQENLYTAFATYSAFWPVINAGAGQYYDATRDGITDLTLTRFNANKTIQWSTYFGGNQGDYLCGTGGDYGKTIDVDDNDFIYLAGYASSNPTTFPTLNSGAPGAFYMDQTNIKGGDNSFVTKFSPTGVLQWSTLYQHQNVSTSGAGIRINGIACSGDKVYFTGQTYRFSGFDIPFVNLSGAYNNTTFVGDQDIFLGRFSNDCVLEWSTYFNGGNPAATGYKQGSDLTVDSDGNLILVSQASGANASVHLMNPGGGAFYQATNPGNISILISKFNTNRQVTWSTYFGSDNLDRVSEVATDLNNNILIACRTIGGNNMPTQNPGGGAFHYATKQSPGTWSSDFSHDGGLMKFSPIGGYLWGTYVGGTGNTNSTPGISSDSEGNIHVVGYTNSTNFPTQFQASSYNDNTNDGGMDLILMKFNNSSVLEWSTYYGSTDGESNYGVKINTSTIQSSCGYKQFFIGSTSSLSVPLFDYGSGAYYEPVKTTSSVALIMYYEDGATGSGSIAPTGITDNQASTCPSESHTLTISGGVLDSGDSWQWYSGSCGGTPVGSGTSINVSPSSTTTYYVRAEGACGTTGCTEITLTVSPVPGTPSVSSNSPVCIDGTIQLNTNPVGGATYVWTGPNGFTSGDQNPQIPTATLAMSGTYSLVVIVSGCSSASAGTSVSVEAPPIATFEYANTPYCAGTGNASVTFIGAGEGGIFSSTAGLVINSSTGQVDLGASIPNTYIVTNTIAAGTCPQVQSTASITIDDLEDATFNYTESAYCLSYTDATPVISGVGGGTFSATPAGLSINASTGIIDFSSSALNDYEITYTTAGACPNSSIFNLSVESNPSAPITSSNSPVCEGGNIDLSTDAVPLATYSWSGPNGFSSNDQNPQNLNVTTLDAGSYTLTYTVDGCTSEVGTVDVVIQALPIADFNYPASPYCINDGSATVTLGGGATSGVFTSTSGLTIDSGSGQVDLISSSPNTYVVTNTIAASGSCPEVQASSSITITDLDDASFSYSASSYCAGGTDEAPMITGVSGGIFSATPAGLSIDPSTGNIDVGLSTIGDYEITYTTSGSCSNSATFDVSILEAPDAPVLTENSATVCAGEEVTITVNNPVGGITYSVYDAQTGGILLGTAPYTFIPTSSDTYYVEAEDAANCSSVSVDFEVVVNPLPVVTSGGNQVICPGDDVMITVAAIETVDWSTGQTGNSIIVSPKETTTYTASVENAEGCTNSVDIIVTVLSDGSVVAQNDQASVSNGSSVNINVLTNDNGFDGLPSIVTNPASGSVVVETDGTITYTSVEGFTGEVTFGYVICSGVCSTICDTALVTIQVTSTEDPTNPLDEFIIPEGFTPNGDGINDLFELPNLHLYPNTIVIIFNRWGAKVFESDNYQNDWQGISQSPLNVGGNELPEGTYYYLITMGGDLNDGISGEVYKGYVYLKR